MNRFTWDNIRLIASPLTLRGHLAVDMLQLPEVNSVLAGAGEAGAMITEVTSFRETTAGDQDVILSPKM